MTERCGGFSKTQKTTDISFLMEVIMITAHEAEMRVWWWVRHDIQSSYGRGVGWCDLLTTRPSSLWLGFKGKHIFQIRRLPQDVAKQQLRLGHVGNIKLGPKMLCLWVGMVGLCAICLLVVKMASSVFPEVRLFLHLVSLGTTAGGLHKKELANRRIVRDTSLASVAFERPAVMVCLQAACPPVSLMATKIGRRKEAAAALQKLPC